MPQEIGRTLIYARRMRWLLLACVLLATPARSETIWIKGEITNAMADAIVAKAPRAPLRFVLDSAGGYMTAGRKLAAIARSERAEVIVISQCSSACVPIFAAGSVRWMLPGAFIGFHGITTIPATGEWAERVRVFETETYIRLIGHTSPRLAERIVRDGLIADPKRNTRMRLPELLAIDPGLALRAADYDSARDFIRQ